MEADQIRMEMNSDILDNYLPVSIPVEVDRIRMNGFGSPSSRFHAYLGWPGVPGLSNSRARQELNQQTISDSSKISIFEFHVIPFRFSASVVN